MSDQKIKEIADNADMIIREYAFMKKDNFIHVFNINDGYSAMMMNADRIMLETNMNEIEQALVMKIWEQDSKYMDMKAEYA